MSPPRASGLLALIVVLAGCTSTGEALAPGTESQQAAGGSGPVSRAPLRTATDMLLLTTAAERAVSRFDAQTLGGRRVLVDVSRFDAAERPFVHSAFRDHIVAAGGVVMDPGPMAVPEPPPGTEVIVEVRRNALGRYDSDFTLGVPPLPIIIPFVGAGLETPGLFIFRHTTAKAYAKFSVFSYSATTRTTLGLRQELWGSAHFEQWFWFGVGPFDGSNDIYPEGHP